MLFAVHGRRVCERLGVSLRLSESVGEESFHRRSMSVDAQRRTRFQAERLVPRVLGQNHHGVRDGVDRSLRYFQVIW